jgi:LuxR family maltose regulon positive regulatory protein
VRLVVTTALLARSLAAQGLVDQAVDELSGVLELAARGDIVRALLDEGEALRPLLERAAARLAKQPDSAARRAFVGRLLRELGAQPAASAPDLLTARELEVLRLAAAGESNTAIAGRLVVSLHTVKKHLTHILAKLDAPSRTAAVARARERGLI